MRLVPDDGQDSEGVPTSGNGFDDTGGPDLEAIAARMQVEEAETSTEGLDFASFLAGDGQTAAPTPTPEAEAETYSLPQIGVDEHGNLTGVTPEQEHAILSNLHYSIAEGYQRAKRTRDRLQADAEDAKEVLDMIRSRAPDGKVSTGVALLKAQLHQAALAAQQGNAAPWEEAPPVNQYLPPTTTTPATLPPDVMEKLDRVVSYQERMAAQEAAAARSAAENSALQRAGLEGDELALAYLRDRRAQGDTRTPEQVLQSYLTTFQKAAAARGAVKRQAAALTPDVRGGRAAPGTPVTNEDVEARIARMNPDERKSTVASILSAFKTR